MQVEAALEQLVRERTAELERAIIRLQKETAKRRKSEEKLLRLNRLYAMLSQTNQAIVHTLQQDSLFHEICRVAIEFGGFRLAWFGLMEGDGGRIKPVAWCGTNDGYLEKMLLASGEDNVRWGATAAAINEGILWICNDIASEPGTSAWHREMKKRGYQSAAAMPLRMHGRVIGAFTIHADRKDYFDRQLVYLLQQLTIDISFAMEHIELAGTRRYTEQRLQKETAERLATLEKLHQKEKVLLQQSRLAAMGEMIGNIAHQWRQPLNSLGLLVQQLAVLDEVGKLTSHDLNNNVRKAMELIRHMSQTINDFRNYFKPDKEKSEFGAMDVITKTLTLIEASFKEQRIKIDIKGDGNPRIYGYANEFSQIFLNILNNAREAFSGKELSSPVVEVAVTTGEEGKALVTITDNAGGIPEEILPKIFDPYFTTKGPEQGTGIGLYMAKTIIEKNMSGALTVRNTGSGAEFRIEV